ncbi:NADPH-dependent FMN reductase [Deinococcus aquiradiocola]|uniref:NAD(P)H-dependent oxidoreductase n=1 Tax=Deinococcus aquiradiocola TaxID=393059 RepID=A0A917P7U3_9DEIO|nr:NADPH-dependent FMN reductase [Deinococcus aquiradiocola]GGJ65918.1 NAD(P)H-dependent oxidoreductase [Deinococcus aquiradiocola]
MKPAEVTPAAPLRFTVLSCSLDPNSRSRVLAHLSRDVLAGAGHHVQLIDLRDTPLPPFDHHAVYDSPHHATLHRAVQDADGVVLAAPVYNWSLGSALKNVIEATGSTGEGRRAAWFDQLVTFVCSGGLPHSYMAAASLQTSLMLDFKCVLNPYQVYASGRDWQDDGQPVPALRARLEKTLAVKAELAARLRGRTITSDWEI